MTGNAQYAALGAAAPSFSDAEASHGAQQAFGVAGTCHRLAGERDLNFCLRDLEP
jgi:hypothetical protein